MIGVIIYRPAIRNILKLLSTQSHHCAPSALSKQVRHFPRYTLCAKSFINQFYWKTRRGLYSRLKYGTGRSSSWFSRRLPVAFPHCYNVARYARQGIWPRNRQWKCRWYKQRYVNISHSSPKGIGDDSIGGTRLQWHIGYETVFYSSMLHFNLLSILVVRLNMMTSSTTVTLNFDKLSRKALTYEHFSLCKPTHDSCVY